MSPSSDPRVSAISKPTQKRIGGNNTPAANALSIFKHPPIIAIDGGAGTGKSWVAHAVAHELGGAPVIDSGRWFRTLGFLAELKNISPSNESAMVALAKRTEIKTLSGHPAFEVLATEHINGREVQFCFSSQQLDSEPASKAASQVGLNRGVREIFDNAQRELAGAGCVTTGRAQGSELFNKGFERSSKQRVLRILLHAKPEICAERRFMQRHGRAPSQAEIAEISAEIRARNERDMQRSIAPLLSPEQARAAGYLVIDTSRLSREDVLRRIMRKAIDDFRDLERRPR